VRAEKNLGGTTMKTPKEILLETHQALTPRLDRLRESVLAGELGGASSVSAMGQKRKNIFAAIPLKLWNELIWPSRRAWAGLAAVWVALAVVHFSQRDSTAFTKSNSAPQMMAQWNGLRTDPQMMAWGEPEQWLLEQSLYERRQMAERHPQPPAPAAPPAASGKSAEMYFDYENDWA
jgi:hypothetical protein